MGAAILRHVVGSVQHSKESERNEATHILYHGRDYF